MYKRQVLTHPGHTQLKRIFFVAYSAASERTAEIRAPFTEEYIDRPCEPDIAATDETATIEAAVGSTFFFMQTALESMKKAVTCRSVSYTHLDVYKRQDKYHVAAFDGLP